MREAFALLSREFTDDEQWGSFIFSAWVARADYGPYRDRLKQARELKEEIADAAANLAKLLGRFSDTGVDGPSEFYWVPELLRKTDSCETQPGSVQMWRALRGRLLGDPARRDTPASEGATSETISRADEAPTIVIRFVQPGDTVEIDPEQQARDLLRYVWQMSPDLPALLQTVAKVARDFEPSQRGMIGAAIISRQRSIRTEYLRAFANRLTDRGLTLTTIVMQAMAFAANVAINLPDVDVSYDDVRKALGKLGGDPRENS